MRLRHGSKASSTIRYTFQHPFHAADADLPKCSGSVLGVMDTASVTPIDRCVRPRHRLSSRRSAGTLWLLSGGLGAARPHLSHYWSGGFELPIHISLNADPSIIYTFLGPGPPISGPPNPDSPNPSSNLPLSAEPASLLLLTNTPPYLMASLILHP